MRRVAIVFVATISVLLLFARFARATVLHGPIVNPANGHSYYLLDVNGWIESEAEAVALGGHLATINDEEEQDFVWNTVGAPLGDPKAFWIGFNDASVEGVFEWVSGEAVTYTNWGPDEPNGAFVDEDYAAMQTTGGAIIVPGQWNDRRNASPTRHAVVRGRSGHDADA